MDINAHKKVCLWILPQNPKPLMLPVSSLRPALIFVFITCNREQSNKEIYKYLEEKTKNIVSGWLRGMKFWASLSLRDKILGVSFNIWKKEKALHSWSFSFLMGLESYQCRISWTWAWPSISPPEALFLAASYPFASPLRGKGLLLPQAWDCGLSEVNAGGC